MGGCSGNEVMIGVNSKVSCLIEHRRAISVYCMLLKYMRPRIHYEGSHSTCVETREGHTFSPVRELTATEYKQHATNS